MAYTPDKRTLSHFTQLGVETTQGDHGSTPYATSDSSFAFHTRAQPVVTPAYQFDGALEGEGSPGGVPRPNIAPSGRWGSFDLAAYMRSPTATYSGTVYPDLWRGLRGHALGLSFATGTLTLAPQRTSLTTLGVDLYVNGELEVFSGVVVPKIAVSLKAGHVPEWTLSCQGIRAQETDATPPALGYTSFSRNYAKFVTTSSGAPAFLFTVGGQAVHGYVREGTWSSERAATELSSSAEQGESGLAHPGWTLGNEVSVFEGIISARTRSGIGSSPYAAASGHKIDPLRIFEGGTTFATQIQSGTMTAQNGFRISGATCSFMGAPERDGNDAEALWKVKVGFFPSSDNQNDSYSITAT